MGVNVRLAYDPSARAVEMLEQVRELLQAAHFIARDLHVELERERGDTLADQIHAARMAAEALRHTLENGRGAQPLKALAEAA